MAGAVARLMVEILGDSTKAVQAFKQTEQATTATEGAAKKTGLSFKSIATGVATGLAVAKVVSFGKAAVGAAEESAVAHERLVATFKGAGDATGALAARAEKYAGALSAATGVDDEAIAGAQALLATFHSVSSASAVQAGVFDRATAAAADLAAAGYGDLNSNAVQLGKALEDPVKGMAALAKSGVTFTAAQKAAIQQMEKTGNHLGAQKIVLENVESQVKGTAAATATGSAKMAVAWGNFQESVGAAILPFVTLVQTKLAGLFAFVSENSSWLVPLVTSAAALIGVIVGVAKAFEIFSTAMKGFKVVVGILRSEWIATNAAFLASPLGLIIIAVVALVAAIVILATKTQFFQTIWRAVTSFMVAAWNATMGAITGAWDAAYRFIAGIFNAIKGVAMSVWGWIRANWPLLLGILTGPFGLAVVMIVRYWSTIVGFFAGIVHQIAAVFATVGNAIVAPFVWAFGVIRNAVDAALGWVEARIRSVLSLVSWGVGAAKSVYNAFARTWNAVQVAVPGVKILGKTVVPGFTLGLPDLPLLQRGGLVLSEGLAYLHPAEVVTPAPAAARLGGPAVVVENVQLSERVDVELLLRRLAFAVQAGRI